MKSRKPTPRRCLVISKPDPSDAGKTKARYRVEKHIIAGCEVLVVVPDKKETTDDTP